jgi:hypothetical protein
MVRFLVPLLLLAAWPAAADVQRMTLGGDLYVAGSGTVADIGAARDLFVAGGTVTAQGTVAEDGHFAGFDVEVETEVGRDLYGFGGTVTLRAPVGEDLTAAGISVRTAPGASVGGNARLTGGSVVIDGPVMGSLMATGGEVVLNAEIGGDVRIAAGELRFGPGARIGGRLDYTAPEPAVILPGVIDPARVSFTQSDRMRDVAAMHREWGPPAMPQMPGPAPLFGFLLITIAFLVVVAAVALSLAPERIEAMRREAVARPGFAILGGVLGLSTAFGLVPVSVMTIVGLPLVPVILLLILILWFAGYAAGVYILALRIWTGLGGAEPAMAGRLGVFAAGLFVVALLNAVPFAGWVLNFTLVLFGIGALAVPVYRGLFAQRAPVA